MPDPNVTHAFAATFVDELARSGLDCVCLAPGSRSTPLAVAFARHPGVRHLVHLDERSAAFFALGRGRSQGRPTALLCTSGTAATEFHAAVVEADLARVPLLVLTADRPPELQGVGANQVIDQVRLYGTAVRAFLDPGPPEDLGDGGRAWRRLAGRALAGTAGPPPGPVHVNLAFREPLLPNPGIRIEPLPASGPPLEVVRSAAPPRPSDLHRLAQDLRSVRRPLIVAGELGAAEAGGTGGGLGAAVDALAAAIGAPVIAEPSSGLRRPGARNLIGAADALLRAAGFAARHRPDWVLRLGAVPTSKAVNALLSGAGCPQLVLDPGGGWRDADLVATAFWRTDPAATLGGLAERLDGPPADAWLGSWQEADAIAAEVLEAELASAPLHEGHVVRALAEAVAALPDPPPVFVGSSLAIRDVDTFWPPSAGVRLYGNRGASGIDGLVSAGLGVADATGGRSVLLVGDLSLYHDMNGLWAIRRHGLRPLVVVLDNNGGGIFDTLPQAGHPDVFEELFGTPLDLRLEAVADLYGLPCVVADEPAAIARALPGLLAENGPAMLIVRFPRRRSAELHAALWRAVGARVQGEGGTGEE